ncbi:MAG: phosphohexomutase domain-containing protein, partial [Planctomycetota bacterium]
MSSEPARSPALFGTDGVRGLAGVGPLSAQNLPRLGRAIGEAMLASGRGAQPGDGPPRAVIGRDTRPTGEAMTKALATGLRAAGIRAFDAGVVPTPAVSTIVASAGYALGLVISASHNPPEYNGVKVFGPTGEKAPDDVQRDAEARYQAFEGFAIKGNPPHPRLLEAADLALYEETLLAVGGGPGALSGLKVAIDCAHGATWEVAPRVLRALGTEVIAVAATGEGDRINDGVGAMHPGHVCDVLIRENADVGFSFDGDGDRVIVTVPRRAEGAADDAAFESAVVRDGDDLIYGLALALQRRGALPGATVVATVMSNLGLELALRERGITLLRTPVGDRHVTRALLGGGFAVGGETSGHIVLPRVLGPTGDGLGCAVTLLAEAVRLAGQDGGRPSLGGLLPGFDRLPQELRKVRVSRKPPLTGIAEAVRLTEEAERELADRGRLLLRYSGTEPVLRVMVEHEDAQTASSVAAR